jgi:photosystem II stability/assembly factor-like uncharacterized protein
MAQGLPSETVSTLPAPPTSLATDPHDQRAAYALLVTNALYRTTDRGQTWQRLPLPVAEQPCRPLDPQNPNRVFPFPQQDVRATQAAPGRILVRANQSLYRSDDRGANWKLVQDQVTAWTVEESEGQDVYVWRTMKSREEHGLYHSHDGGDTWQQVYAGFFPPQLHSESFTPNHEGITSFAVLQSDYLCAGTDFGIFRSTNGGRTWHEFNTGLPATQRAYRWVPLFVGSYLNTYALTEFSPDGLTQQIVLARYKSGFISPDQDAWQVIGDETLARHLNCAAGGLGCLHTLVLDPIRRERLYLGTAQGLLVSEDAGDHWQAIDLPGVTEVYRIAAASDEKTQLYLWTDKGLVTTTLPEAARATPVPSARKINLELVSQVGGQSFAVAVEGKTAFLGVGPRLVALDISNPNAPRVVGQSDVLPGVIQDIAISNSQALVAAGDAGLLILDISSRTRPREIASVRKSASVWRVAVQGSRAYVAQGKRAEGVGEGSVGVIDIANPAEPRLVGSLEMPGWIHAVAVADKHVYVAHASGLQVVDASDQPNERDAVTLPAEAEGVAIADGYAYVVSGDLHIFDISDSAHPREVGTWRTPALPLVTIAVAGKYAYVTNRFCEFGSCGSRLYVLDVSNPTELCELGSVGIDDAIADIVIAGTHVYWAAWEGGLGVVDVTNATHPHVVGRFEDAGSVADVALFDHYAYVSNSGDRGLQVLDISDSSRLRQVGSAPYRWAGGYVITGGHAYVPAWGDGLRILNLSNPTAPRQVSILTPDVLGGMAIRAVASGRYVYMTTSGPDGLRAIDAADPAHPHVIGAYASPGSIHGLAVTGDRIYVADNEYQGNVPRGFLRAIDAHDSADLRVIGSTVMPGEAWGMKVVGHYAYATTADCYYSTCAGSLQVVDVSDPAHPHPAGSLNLETGAFDLATSGGTLYVAGGEAGVWAIDMSDPTNPRVAGRINTPGSARKLVLAGQTIYVADGSGGLLILQIK